MANRRKPAPTPDARENQLIFLATELAEKQMREGTASAQVISHFLKMGSPRERLERQRLESENQLMELKKEAIASAGRVEELYSKALDAMRGYQGNPAPPEEYDYED